MILLFLFLIGTFSQNLFALEISLQGAKEQYQDFSTLHIRDNDKFLCQEFADDFEEIEKIVCAFSKAPSQTIRPIRNNFFEITAQIKRKTFFLVIKPYERMKLVPIIFDLTKNDAMFNADVKLSKHWMIVGYKDKLPYMKKITNEDSIINFPFVLQEDSYPFVGSLDMQGKPVHIKKVGDVTEYMKIKKFYAKKKYEFTLDLANEVIKKYPNSLFMPELLFYKIRVYDKLKNYDELIKIAKEYLRDYSASENVAEVLSLIAKAYYKIGMNTDADYFFDRLFDEHKGSLYANWGYIYKGEMSEVSGASKKAQRLYKKALNNTKSIEVAVSAAYKLAQYYLENSKNKEALVYIKKIVKAKPKYFAEHMNESMNMMYDFADMEEYESAALVAKALYDNTKKGQDERESLLKDAGIWLSKTTQKKDALVNLNLYLEEFSDGLYEEEVQFAKDGLFFQGEDENITTVLANYDKLMIEYDGDSIGKKAIYEKAKLLIKNEMFKDALELKDKLLTLDQEEYKDIAELIKTSAIGTMQQALEVKECGSVLSIASEYKIELSDRWDDGVYECAMKGADYELAKKMADKNLNSQDIQHRKKWLYRYIKIDFATGNYSNVIKASKELITLIKDDKDSKYKEIYRYLFDTYHRLENPTKMIMAMGDVEKAFNLNYKDMERYVAMISVGSEQKDDNLVILYGKKVMQIQKNSSSSVQSPFVEFALYEAYNNKEDYNNALEVIKSLDKVELKPTTRARQKYLLGSVYSKLWQDDNAKKAYKEAIEADKNSAWAKLAKGALEI